MSTRNSGSVPERRVLKGSEREALEKFAKLDISLEELERYFGKMLSVSFTGHERKVTSYFLLPVPGVRVELGDVRNVMGKHQRGEITTKQLSEWAAMLLLNEAYDWEGPDEDEIADWLNEISLLTLKPKENNAPGSC